MSASVGVVALWAACGWLLGAAAGIAIRPLLQSDGDEEEAAPPAKRGALLAPDPQLQLMLASTFAILAAVRGPSLALAIQSLFAVALVLVLLIDARTRYVYSVIAYPAIAAGVALTPLATGQPYWSGLAGALLGGAVLLALRLVGAAVYRGREAVARGDVTIAALVGATTGIYLVVPALLVGTLLGGLIAAGTALARRSLQGTMPYGPGLCLGALAMLAHTPR